MFYYTIQQCGDGILETLKNMIWDGCSSTCYIEQVSAG